MSETKQLQYGDYIDTIELKYKLNKEFITQGESKHKKNSFFF